MASKKILLSAILFQLIVALACAQDQIYLSKSKQYRLGNGVWVLFRGHSHVWTNSSGRVVKGALDGNHHINKFRTARGKWITVMKGFLEGNPPYCTWFDNGNFESGFIKGSHTIQNRQGRFAKYSDGWIKFDSDGYVLEYKPATIKWNR